MKATLDALDERLHGLLTRPCGLAARIVCAALTAAFIVCAVLFNRGGAEFTSVVAGEKQYARVAVFEGGSLLAAGQHAGGV